MPEHDKRFKQLLKEFFIEFMRLFFPEYAVLFDFSTTEWLDKEQFLDPPHGEVLEVDLLAKLRLKNQPDADVVAVIHVEVESRDAVATFPKRMFEYYQPLWRKFDGRVLPLALYLKVGHDGLGVGTHIETFGGLEILRFRYLYVGLPELDAATFLQGYNWLGVALAALMHMPRDQRILNRAHALRKLLVECQENLPRRRMLIECVERYLQLDEEQESAFKQLLKTRYPEVEPMMQTTFEKMTAKAREEGREQGRTEVLQSLIRKHLERRFGPLSAEVLKRLEAWPHEGLEELALTVTEAPSLQALGLAD